MRSRKELYDLHKSYIGKKIGIMTILGISKNRSKSGAICLDAICECEKKFLVPFHNLEKNRIKSCGFWKSSKKRSDKTFLNKFEKENSCWIWKGKINSHNGYGYTSKVSAHRYSYEFHKGKILNDLHVLHTCNNKLCVNPDHLYLGTTKDNVQDAIMDGVYKLRSLTSKRWKNK